MKVYKIRNKKTGLFSKCIKGYYGEDENGKAWSSESLAIRHIRQCGYKQTYRENFEIVEFEIIEKSSRDVDFIAEQSNAMQTYSFIVEKR